MQIISAQRICPLATRTSGGCLLKLLSWKEVDTAIFTDLIMVLLIVAKAHLQSFTFAPLSTINFFSGQYKTWTADYGLRTTDYGLRTTDWV